MGGEGAIKTAQLNDVENTIVVAVGKNVKEGKSILLWAMERFPEWKMCLLHVHQPSQLLTLMDGKLPASKLKRHAIKAYQELERQKVNKLLDQYLFVLAEGGVQACKMWIELDNVEKGIVEFITRHGIRWLVMGAASEKHYSRELTELKSNKAIFVFHQAPVSCFVWFVCRGILIQTGCVSSMAAESSPLCTRPSILLLDHVEDEDAIALQCSEDSPNPIHKVNDNSESTPLLMSEIKDHLLSSLVKLSSDDELSPKLIHKVTDNSESTPLLMSEIKGDSLLSSPVKLSSDDELCPSSFLLLDEKSQEQSTDDIHDKLENAMVDVENAKQEAFEESLSRWRAEEDAMEAINRAEASENLCTEEINRRKEMEEMLEKQRQELEQMSNRRTDFMKELEMTQNQKQVLENRIRKSRCMEEELEEKIIQAVELLISFKEKRDELQIDHEQATREVHRLRRTVEGDGLSSGMPHLSALSFVEIIEATGNFEPSLKIGEGRCGTVYKGFVRHTKVAIKMLPSCGSCSDSEFKHKAGILSKVRHPNLVTLMGICPESRSLIYEYLDNGSLEDRLASQGKTVTLKFPWQTRIKIAADICFALIFIHSNNPPIIHGNLKPTKILLNSNFGTKITDLGIDQLIPNTKKPCNNKVEKEDSLYTDPEFFESGELTVESDVYSFGIVLLWLLTGRSGFLDIVKDVKCALEMGNFDTVLDCQAGDWPFEHATRLACVAVRCCEKKRLDRPDLVSEVWPVIEPMRQLCSSSSPEKKGHHHRQIPSHFMCPIFQEVMEDPYIAADGFTYEADAIRGWLNSGHKTSPMTNLKLDNCDLLPNYALYYAIQEWQNQQA